MSLAELVAVEPLQQGLAEIIAYLSLAAEDRAAVIDDAAKQQLRWRDADGAFHIATVPMVIFQRGTPRLAGSPA